MKKPKNYYCHRNISKVQIAPEGYEVIDKIGEGAFGEVYKVFHQDSSSIQVMKKTKQAECAELLLNKQSEIMHEMHNSDGFAKIEDQSTGGGCLIMTLLGDSLEKILERASINLVDMKRIGYQCISRLRELHQRGYVHRDIKPENILLGNQNRPHKVYLVDFGLSSTYKKGAKVHRKAYNGQIGTIKFCPIASHYGYDQFPKDDLQSMGYLLIYIATKTLPWHALPKGLGEKEKFQEIRMRKETTQVQKLTQGISCLRKYFKEIKALKIDSQLNYDKLLEIFHIPCEEVFCYSFCTSTCFSKLKLLKEEEEDDTSVFESRIQIMHSLKKSIELAPHRQNLNTNKNL